MLVLFGVRSAVPLKVSVLELFGVTAVRPLKVSV